MLRRACRSGGDAPVRSPADRHPQNRGKRLRGKLVPRGAIGMPCKLLCDVQDLTVRLSAPAPRLAFAAFRRLLAQNYQKFGRYYQAGTPGSGLYPRMKYKPKPVEHEAEFNWT